VVYYIVTAFTTVGYVAIKYSPASQIMAEIRELEMQIWEKMLEL